MDDQGIGLLPVSIAAEPVWREPAAGRQAVRAAWRDFVAAGLADGTELRTDAAIMLDILARPEVAFVAVMLGDSDGGVAGAVVAARGDKVTVAVRRGDEVTLARMRGAALPDTLVRQLPDARPAPVDAVNIHVSDLSAGEEPETGLLGEPVDFDPWRDGWSSTRRDTDTLARLRGLRVIGQGELYVSVRDNYGRERQSELIRYQDYRIGRIVVVMDRGYLSIAPASKTYLRDRLATAHHDLTKGAQ